MACRDVLSSWTASPRCIATAAAAALPAGAASLPLTALTRGGFPLAVHGSDPARWELAGDARVLAHGRLLPDALQSPKPPPWV